MECEVKLRNYKKVLLRELKRHTARRVASARGGGGYLLWPGVPTLGTPSPSILSWPGGEPTLGYPFPLSWPGRGRGTYLGWGVPTLGYPSPVLTWLGGGGTYLGQGGGTYLGRGGTYLGRGTPYPRCDRQTPVKTVLSHRTTYVGSNYLVLTVTANTRSNAVKTTRPWRICSGPTAGTYFLLLLCANTCQHQHFCGRTFFKCL